MPHNCSYPSNRKWNIFLSEIRPTGDSSLLDVGYSDKEYSAVDNFLEKHLPHQGRITALGTEEPIEFSRRYPQIKVIKYDGGGVFHFQTDSLIFAGQTLRSNTLVAGKNKLSF